MVVKGLPGNHDPGRDARRRLRALGDTGSAHIARVEDVLPLNGRWSVVMEYIEGLDLSTALRAGPLPPRAAIAVVQAAAEALHAAWSAGKLRLTHRNICPGNLRVTVSGEVKLLDFGLRPDDAEKSPSMSRIPYLAPERFDSRATSASDVYALGVVLFELLMGQPPGPSAASPERRPPGVELNAQWKWLRQSSVPLYDLIVDMLDPNPAARPNADEVASVLGRIRARLLGDTLEQWAARAVSEMMAATTVAFAPGVGTLLLETPAAPETEPGERGRATRPLLVAGGALAVGLGLIGAAGLALGLGLAFDAPSPSVARAPTAAVAVGSPTPVARNPASTAAPVSSTTAASTTGASVAPNAGVPSGPASTAPSATASTAPSSTTPVPKTDASTPAAPSSTASTTTAATRSAPTSPAPVPSGAASKSAAPAEASRSGSPTTAAPSASSASASKAATVPAVAPAKAPATAPDPPAQPQPTGSGTLTVVGDVGSVELSGPGGRASPGKVAAGTWTVSVTLTNGQQVSAKNVVVSDGAAVTVRCTVAFGGQCRPL